MLTHVSRATHTQKNNFQGKKRTFLNDSAKSNKTRAEKKERIEGRGTEEMQ